jgi:hypothetical protein
MGWDRRSLAPCPAVLVQRQLWLRMCLVEWLAQASSPGSKVMEVVLGLDQRCPTCDEEDEMLADVEGAG